MLNPNCNSSIDPSFLGYDPVLDGELFKISIDMRSVTLALAINLGVTRLATLEVVEGDLHREFNASNTSIVGDQFIDPLVAGMQPIYCLGGANETMDTFDDICFIQIGNVVMLPLFNSFGYDDSRPSYCNW